MGLAHTLGSLISAPLLSAWEAHIREAVDAALDAREPAEPEDLQQLGVHLGWARDALTELQADLRRTTQRAADLRARAADRPPSKADELALRLAGLQANEGVASEGVDRVVAGVHALSDRLVALRPPLTTAEQRAAEAEAEAERALAEAERAAARLARAAADAERPPAPKVCKVDGCEQPFRARGLCGKHYQLWKRGRLPAIVGEDGGLFFVEGGPRWQLDRGLAAEPARLVDGRVWVRGADVTPG
jgi:hypothetical protein